MTEWTDFNIVGENIVTYLLGSYTVLAVIITIMFLIVLISVGIEFKYSFIFTLPVIGIFMLGGWFGAAGWVANAFLIGIAFIYGFALVRLLR